MTMTTDISGGPGAFRRLMNKVATWSEHGITRASTTPWIGSLLSSGN